MTTLADKFREVYGDRTELGAAGFDILERAFMAGAGAATELINHEWRTAEAMTEQCARLALELLKWCEARMGGVQ